MYHNFNFLYNEWFFNSHIPQWMPNHAFGMPTSYIQLLALTPSSYFMFIFGKLFGITNSSVLFNISVYMDQLILVFGTYLLSKQIFKSTLTIFIVCSAIAANTYWDGNINFHLRVSYLLPLTLYFFLMFYKKTWLGYLWLGLLTTVISVTGDLIYFLPFKIFSLLLFNICLWFIFKPSWHPLKFCSGQIFLCAIFMTFLFCFYHQLAIFRDFVDVPCRENGQTNSLQTFLTYWSVPPGSIGDFLKNNVIGRNPLLYMGILPTLFLLYGIYTLRSGLFFAFLLPAAGILWFSFGAIFTTICYYFPTMDYFRHISHIYNFYNTFFVIAAGFGIDLFLQSPLKNKFPILLAMSILLVFIVDGTDFRHSWVPYMILSSPSLMDFFGKIHLSNEYFRIGSCLILFIIAFLAASVGSWIIKNNADRTLEKIVRVCLLSCFVLDMYSYLLNNSIRPQPDENSFPYVVNVNRLEYQDRRHDLPETPREKNVLSLIQTHGGPYETIYSIAQFSPCSMPYRRDYIPKRFVTLSKVGNDISKRNFDMITACQFQKLRVIPKATINTAPSKIKEQFVSIPEFSKNFIIENYTPLSSDKKTDQTTETIENSIITVSSFTTDALTVKTSVTSPSGAWLVYADSFHPGWKAIVNGKNKPIFPANLAFKAVHLDQGNNVVQWIFDNRYGHIASYLIALISLIFCIFLCGWFFKELLWYSRNNKYLQKYLFYIKLCKNKKNHINAL